MLACTQDVLRTTAESREGSVRQQESCRRKAPRQASVTLNRAGAEAGCGDTRTCPPAPLPNRVTHAHQGNQEGLPGDQKESQGRTRARNPGTKSCFPKETRNLPKMVWPAPKLQGALPPRPTPSCGRSVHRTYNEVRVAARPHRGQHALCPRPSEWPSLWGPLKSHSPLGRSPLHFLGFSPPSSSDTCAWFTVRPLHLLPPLPLPLPGGGVTTWGNTGR